jgi:large subunit ribosomal protein L32
MAVPKRKTSKSKRNMRRAHDAIKHTPALHKCPNCGEMKLYHRVCPSCGHYRGREVIEMEE